MHDEKKLPTMISAKILHNEPFKSAIKFPNIWYIKQHTKLLFGG